MKENRKKCVLELVTLDASKPCYYFIKCQYLIIRHFFQCLIIYYLSLKFTNLSFKSVKVECFQHNWQLYVYRWRLWQDSDMEYGTSERWSSGGRWEGPKDSLSDGSSLWFVAALLLPFVTFLIFKSFKKKKRCNVQKLLPSNRLNFFLMSCCKKKISPGMGHIERLWRVIMLVFTTAFFLHLWFYKEEDHLILIYHSGIYGGF